MEHIGTYTSFVGDTIVISAKTTIGQGQAVDWSALEIGNVWKRLETFFILYEVDHFTLDTFFKYEVTHDT